jgi:hypothetical protein
MERKLSLEELTRQGSEFYLDELKEKLERDHMGEYAIIDVENKRYVVGSDGVDAVHEAQRVFGEKLFFIVRIGNLWKTEKRSSEIRHAWYF